jgi:P-aminobenzoate N-oxygenase AurF
MDPHTIDLPAPLLSPYSGSQIRFAVEAWPMRAAEELRSALIFRALARAAYLVGMPDPWPSRLAAAVHDEIRHARLCATVGSRLGARAPRYDVRPVRARLAGLSDALSRVAALLLVEVAIGETISMYMFRAVAKASAEPLTRAALRSILRDEARHQRLGWDGLHALWPMLPEAHRAQCQQEAARGLAACEQQIAPAMRWLERRTPFDAAYAALGVLHPEVRIEAFYVAVERLVLPRLTRLGLDGTRAWEARYRVVPRPPPNARCD